MRAEQQQVAALQPKEAAIAGSEQNDIIAAQQNARVMLRAIAQRFTCDERFAFAQAVGHELVKHWWSGASTQCATSLSVRRAHLIQGEGKLDPSIASIAESMGTLAAHLEPEIAAYQIGLTYTYLLPPAYRSTHGIYYTPPVLTDRLIQLSEHSGIDWATCRVLDPACGGGAFLAPIAKHIIAHLPDCSPRILLENIANRLRGYELDPFGAWLAQVALDVVLLPFSAVAGKKTPNLVTVCDSLEKNPPKEPFDLVIGNPPYGRTRLSAELRQKFKRGLFGHANLYGIFTDIALRHTRVGGVIAFVTPTSFLAGEYFKNLRSLLGSEAPPLHIDFVAARKGVFDDVLQETLLATYRRGDARIKAKITELHVTSSTEPEAIPLGSLALPADLSAPWILPRNIKQTQTVRQLQACKHRLVDWGYTVSTGPLVWNRFKDQIHLRKANDRLPLIWAESVLPDGRFEWRATKRNHKPWFEIRDRDQWLVSQQQCVLLQRTTAKEQHRRLIAAALPQAFIETHGAIVVENHLNMLKPLGPTPPVSVETLSAFLNSAAADQAFRCVSGSVAVSAYELEALPLPSPAALDDLQAMIDRNADRDTIELECLRLYREAMHG